MIRGYASLARALTGCSACTCMSSCFFSLDAIVSLPPNLLYARVTNLRPIYSPETISRPLLSQSPLRLPVYEVLLDPSGTDDEVLRVSRADVEKWLKERVFMPSVMSAFLERLIDVLSKAGQPQAYHYKLAHIYSLDPASRSPRPCQTDSDPTIFNFHNLFQLTAVLAAQAHPLFASGHS
ncbi:hypothetical protein EDB89DRAFT_1998690 [Lactarius sanguifluus]|nr:hypothetical protein EDB89DRAFT_1998690 [Lactarius sanguifluus]